MPVKQKKAASKRESIGNGFQQTGEHCGLISCSLLFFALLAFDLADIIFVPLNAAFLEGENHPSATVPGAFRHFSRGSGVLCFEGEMMKKLYASIRKRPVNPVLMIGVLALYCANNHYLKFQTDGVLRLFFVCYFNDLICPLFFFAYANLLLLTVGRELHKLWCIALIGLGISLIWEFFAPVLKPTATADPVDIICYLLGSTGYWAILHFVRKDRGHGKKRIAAGGDC